MEEEQAGFRSQKITTDQTINSVGGKHLEHQKELYHNFIDFKKAFDRVWHEGLWRVLTEYSIDNRLIEVVKSLYDEATSAVLLNVCTTKLKCWRCLSDNSGSMTKMTIISNII